ncbi:MAG: flavodoxin-dependent (E)-4-hydroxy-3-methylbut-2-enyl-diphosphate synthase, partial [Alphaproteobacteria bacterium]
EGVDIVRVSCPFKDSTKALKSIIKQVEIPVVADIHFNYKRAIEAANAGAACLRINPGNIGTKEKIHDVIKSAVDNNCSMRIGINAGSLEENILQKYKEPSSDAMVESALNHMKILEDFDFFNFKISVKASNVSMAIKAYLDLAKKCDYPLHIGITEAGGRRIGTVRSSIGIGYLLSQGIGDTIRVSLSFEPEEEVRVGVDILKALKLRRQGVDITSCPSCARQQFDVIRIVEELEKRFSHLKEYISLSIIGCVVNGPGEAKKTEIGIVGGANGMHQIYIDGIPFKKIPSGEIISCVEQLVKEKIRDGQL